MTRRQERGVVIVLMFVLAGFLEYLGSIGWRINLVPAQYVGYLVAGITMLALAGVNIWHKGPLDPNDDPRQPEIRGRLAACHLTIAAGSHPERAEKWVRTGLLSPAAQYRGVMRP